MRLFIAVDTDETLRDGLAQLARAARMTRVREVARHQQHLTLRFLGDGVDAARVPLISAALAGAAARHERFSVDVAGGGGVFGKRRSPHVIWAGLVDGGARLGPLVSDIDAALAELGFPERDKPFTAHITLARGRDGCRVDVDALEAFGPVGKLAVDDVVLFESKTSPTGPIYTALARAPLR